MFTLPTYTTVGGKTIKDVKVGYETYGKLNAAGDNAIFVPHFFSGTSHAAGKYAPGDAAPGYWDPIIGAGRPIDTDKYFVISADTLSNLNTKDPNVVTTGPASVNPDTGKPYGMTFPVISLRDSVRVHKALVDSLGVKKLQAVAGASGGSIQAMEWAALYPAFVERVVHVIGPGFDISSVRDRAASTCGSMPIRLDPKWNNGDYYGRDEPLEGVAVRSRSSRSRRARSAGRRRPSATSGPTPRRIRPMRCATRLRSRTRSTRRARRAPRPTDANSIIYTAKANQLYRLTDDEVKGIKAKILFVPAASDEIFPPELSQRAAARYRRRAAWPRSRSSKATAVTSKACSTSRSRARRFGRSWRNDSPSPALRPG